MPFELMVEDLQPCVYIMANRRNGVLYTGVTSDLTGRVYQHREGTFDGFSKRHGTHMLVWYELHEDIEAAILREKRIKKWNRLWKTDLIEKDDPDWRDLALDLGFERLPTLKR